VEEPQAQQELDKKLRCQKKDVKKMLNQATAPTSYQAQMPSSKVVPTWRHLAAMGLFIMAEIIMLKTWGLSDKDILGDILSISGMLMFIGAFVCCFQLTLLVFLVVTPLELLSSWGVKLTIGLSLLTAIGILIILYYRLAKVRSFAHLGAGVKAIPMIVTQKGRAALGQRAKTGSRAMTPMMSMTSMPISAGGEAAPGGPRGRFEVIPAGEMRGFESIGGMEALKGELRETVGLVLRHPKEAALLKVEHGGVLLYGPPGTGKSAFARAVAGEFGLNAILLNASNLSTEGLLGVAAQKIGEAFELAKKNLPCLVFIDELDTMGGSRNAMNADQAAVGAFLTQLDAAVKVNGLVVVGATNYLDRVDTAVRRPGRFDLCVEIKLPNAKGREAILRAHLQGRPCGQDIELGELVAATEGWSGAKVEVIVKRAAMSALGRVETGGSSVILQSDLELGLQKAQEFQEPESEPAKNENPLASLLSGRM
jgi:hypothetical protein